METKFNFNSQICTTREQSERLLALGLKKETADMHYSHYRRIPYEGEKYDFWQEEIGYSENGIPAWSLARLVEMATESPKEYCMIWVPNAYDDIIHDIESLIKEGYFNKDYLV